MSAIGAALTIHGNIDTEADLTIEGRVRGHVWGAAVSITIAPGAEGTGDIAARRVFIAGQVTGNVSATERLEILPTARVRGRVIAAAFVLCEGAWFTGPVHSQKLD